MESHRSFFRSSSPQIPQTSHASPSAINLLESWYRPYSFLSNLCHDILIFIPFLSFDHENNLVVPQTQYHTHSLKKQSYPFHPTIDLLPIHLDPSVPAFPVLLPTIYSTETFLKNPS
ncbi:hypothetical protein BDR06DRAFT_1015025 [Suillus hirtellus]|nr:hypothetical protein BDR06DRAFT_1015025 [Suillus hirtellus]